MTPETSNGSASDDQRCYIERLQRIETAAKGLCVHYHVERHQITIALDKHHPPVYEETVTVKKHLWDALKTALEANR